MINSLAALALPLAFAAPVQSTPQLNQDALAILATSFIEVGAVLSEPVMYSLPTGATAVDVRQDTASKLVAAANLIQGAVDDVEVLLPPGDPFLLGAGPKLTGLAFALNESGLALFGGQYDAGATWLLAAGATAEELRLGEDYTGANPISGSINEMHGHCELLADGCAPLIALLHDANNLYSNEPEIIPLIDQILSLAGTHAFTVYMGVPLPGGNDLRDLQELRMSVLDPSYLAGLQVMAANAPAIAEVYTIAALELANRDLGIGFTSFGTMIQGEVLLYYVNEDVDPPYEPEPLDECLGGSGDCPDLCSDSCDCDAPELTDMGWGGTGSNPDDTKSRKKILLAAALLADTPPLSTGIVDGVVYIITTVGGSTSEVPPSTVNLVTAINSIAALDMQLWVRAAWGVCEPESCTDWFSWCIIGWSNIQRKDCIQHDEWIHANFPGQFNTALSTVKWLEIQQGLPGSGKDLSRATQKAANSVLKTLNAARGDC